MAYDFLATFPGNCDPVCYKWQNWPVYNQM